MLYWSTSIQEINILNSGVKKGGGGNGHQPYLGQNLVKMSWIHWLAPPPPPPPPGSLGSLLNVNNHWILFFHFTEVFQVQFYIVTAQAWLAKLL